MSEDLKMELFETEKVLRKISLIRASLKDPFIFVAPPLMRLEEICKMRIGELANELYYQEIKLTEIKFKKDFREDLLKQAELYAKEDTK